MKSDISITEDSCQDERTKEKKKSLWFDLLGWGGFGFAIYIIGTGYFGTPPSLIHRPIVVGIILFYTFLNVNIAGEKKCKPKWYDIIFAIACLASCLYISYNYNSFIMRILFMSPVTIFDLISGIILVVLVIEASRRLLGWAMPIICTILIIYGLYGHLLKGTFRHHYFSVANIVEQLSMNTNGIFGSACHTAVTTVAMFIIFGSVMNVTGTGDLFMDIANSICGRFSGAPAKTSVVSSALMGMISGNSVANVVTSGTFTIPAMKKAGFSPEYAGAVEAVASTGGQIMPPIMGAAAFLMADFTGIPYSKIIIYALIPAFLYYLAIMLQVHFRSKKQGLKGLPSHEIPSLWKTLLGKGVFALPVVGLIMLLISGYTPMRSGFIAITFNIILGLIFSKDRKTVIFNLIKELKDVPQKLLTVMSATCAAGIIIGILYMTGVTNRISSILIAAANGNLLLGLVLSMLLAILLGMGMPTSGAYIVMATLVAPGLMEMGLSAVQAHMFVMYFACMSAITPPVALASYAGAAIAGANPSKVGFTAWKLALTAFIIPYMFAYGSDLLVLNGFISSIVPLLTACLGCLCLACSIEGYMIYNCNKYQRLIAGLAALLLIDTGFITDFVGLLLLVSLVIWQIVSKRLENKYRELSN